MAVHARVVELLEASKVAAGAERAARPGHDHRTHLGVARGPIECAGERVTQVRIERVALLGTVQRERQHSLVDRLEQRPVVNA